MEINTTIHVEQPAPPGMHRQYSIHRSVMDKQTDKKTKRFWLFRRRVKSEPHQTWHGDRGPRACSCTSKTFRGL